jgi:pimeloyl-ACP methyl ester carboxylesterase
VAREVYRNVDNMVAARALYARVSAPVTAVYVEHDWSRPAERDANLAPLERAVELARPYGHFAALEQPHRVAETLLDRIGT